MPRHSVRSRLLAALFTATGACHRAPPPPSPPRTSPAADPPAAQLPAPPLPAPTSPDAAGTPPLDAARVTSALRAANRSARTRVPEGELYCGGSAGEECLNAIVEQRSAAIDAIGRLLAQSASPPDDAAACRLRGALGRLLAIVQNARTQAAGGPDSSDEDGYCDCAIPAVALSHELEAYAAALAVRCPAADTACRVTMPVAFHLRPDEFVASTGRELPAGTAIDLLATATIARRGQRMYLVALADHTATGYTFLAPSQVPAGCQLPGP